VLKPSSHRHQLVYTIQKIFFPQCIYFFLRKVISRGYLWIRLHLPPAAAVIKRSRSSLLLCLRHAAFYCSLILAFWESLIKSGKYSIRSRFEFLNRLSNNVSFRVGKRCELFFFGLKEVVVGLPYERLNNLKFYPAFICWGHFTGKMPASNILYNILLGCKRSKDCKSSSRDGTLDLKMIESSKMSSPISQTHQNHLLNHKYFP
jgi:hypothetical protein